MPQIATGGFRPHWSTHAGKSGFAHLGPFLNGGQSHLPRSSLQVPSPQPSPCQHGLGLAVPSVATLSAGSFLAAAVSNSGSFAARAGGGSSTGGSTTEVGATAVGASLAADAAAAAARSSFAARSSAAGAFSSCFSPSMRFFSSSWSWSMRCISAGSWKAFRVVVVVLGPLLEKRRSAKRAAAVPTSTLREPAIATKVGVLKTNDLARRPGPTAELDGALRRCCGRAHVGLVACPSPSPAKCWVLKRTGGTQLLADLTDLAQPPGSGKGRGG